MGFHHVNYSAKEQLEFYSVMEKLVLAGSSDKDAAEQLITDNKNITKSNKALTT